MAVSDALALVAAFGRCETKLGRMYMNFFITHKRTEVASSPQLYLLLTIFELARGFRICKP